MYKLLASIIWTKHINETELNGPMYMLKPLIICDDRDRVWISDLN